MIGLLDIKNIVLDLLFPKFCVNCNIEGESWLCEKCARDIIPVVSQVCLACGKLSADGVYHKKCKKNIALKAIIASAYFEEGPIREMIHNFKYNGVIELGAMLSELIVDALTRCYPIKDDNMIIAFVPLHWRRQAQRGYNQAEILARAVGAKLNIAVADLLIKNRSTKRQAQLTGKNRRKNLSGVFILKPGIDIKKKKIIIVDDITTTGSTLNECARVLKIAGVKEVWGLVVARG